MKLLPYVLIGGAAVLVGALSRDGLQPGAEVTILATAIWLAYGVNIYLSRRR